MDADTVYMWPFNTCAGVSFNDRVNSLSPEIKIKKV